MQDARSTMQAESACSLHPASCITFTSPAPDTHVLIDPHLPLATQQLEITLVAPDDLDHVEVQLDGRVLTTLTASPYRIWWMLQPGEHSFVAIAVDRAGNRRASESIHVTVEQ